MDKGYYRQVPYRFFTNQAETDTCKLEKLTNLFPEMKSTIELGERTPSFFVSYQSIVPELLVFLLFLQ